MDEIILYLDLHVTISTEVEIWFPLLMKCTQYIFTCAPLSPINNTDTVARVVQTMGEVNSFKIWTLIQSVFNQNLNINTNTASSSASLFSEEYVM
jgi:hypothetical protein